MVENNNINNTRKFKFSDLIEELDKRKSTRLYWTLAAIATTGGFLFGYDTTNIGSALLFLPYTMTSFELGYLVAGASLGAAIGALLAGPITDRSGRKYILIADAGIYAIAAILSAVSFNLIFLLLSRTLIGLAVGADSAIATVYLVELAPKNKRGSLAVMQQMMIVIGIVIAFIVAIIVFSLSPVVSFEKLYGCRILLGVAAIPAVLALAFRTRMPESPRWLILKGKYKHAQKSLMALGIDIALDKLEELKYDSELINERQNKKFKWTPGIKYAFMVIGIWIIFQQITGINIPLYYGPLILDKLHLFPSVVNPVYVAIYSIMATLIFGIVLVVFTYVMLIREDTTGRRKLGLVGFAGMAAGMFVTTIFLYAHFEIGIILSLSIFLAFFSIGVGGAGWLLQAEYFPTNVRATLASWIAALDWAANFAIIEIFPSMESSIGLGGSMLVFGVLAVIIVIILYEIMPETKDLNLEQVSNMFKSIGEKKLTVKEEVSLAKGNKE